MEKDERIADGLRETTIKIDQMDAGTPDLMAVVNFVSDEQTRIAVKNNKQLAVFSCTALAILSVFIVLYQLSALAFAVIQVLFLTVPAVLLLLRRRRGNDLT